MDIVDSSYHDSQANLLGVNSANVAITVLAVLDCLAKHILESNLSFFEAGGVYIGNIV
jgi:hypothetical protein